MGKLSPLILGYVCDLTDTQVAYYCLNVTILYVRRRQCVCIHIQIQSLSSLLTLLCILGTLLNIVVVCLGFVFFQLYVLSSVATQFFVPLQIFVLFLTVPFNLSNQVECLKLSPCSFIFYHILCIVFYNHFYKHHLFSLDPSFIFLRCV